MFEYDQYLAQSNLVLASCFLVTAPLIRRARKWWLRTVAKRPMEENFICCFQLLSVLESFLFSLDSCIKWRRGLVWSCTIGTDNTSVCDLMIMSKISHDAVQFLRTETQWCQQSPSIMCRDLCRDESFEIVLDRHQKADPINQLENPSLPMQIHILVSYLFYTQMESQKPMWPL